MTQIQLNTAQQTILHIMQIEKKAMSAYALLERVKPLGIQAPTQIYRILNKLMQHSLVVKIDTLNMYLAHECRNQQSYQLLTICTECQRVECIELPQLGQLIRKSLHQKHFSSNYQHLELLGQCASCLSRHQD